MTKAADLAVAGGTVQAPGNFITRGTVNAGGANPFNNTLANIDFTGLPSWVRRITVMFNGVSTNGTSQVQVQLGDSGGVEATGYNASIAIIVSSSPSNGSLTTGFPLGGVDAANIRSGIMQIATLGSNVWVVSAVIKGGTGTVAYIAGDKTLSDVLDRVRVTTVNGTDLFDAGSINILYEG